MAPRPLQRRCVFAVDRNNVIRSVAFANGGVARRTFGQIETENDPATIEARGAETNALLIDLAG
jgi:hypothetical protein